MASLGISLCFAAQAIAQPFIAVDSRTRAMGTAGVAAAEGPSASYWNPANLARGSEGILGIKWSKTAFDLNVFADAQVHGDVVETFDRLLNDFASDVDGIQTRFNAETATVQDVRDIFEIVDGLADLNKPGNGVLGDVGGVATLRLGNFALSYRLLGMISGTTNIDLTTASLANEGKDDLLQVAQNFIDANVAAGDPLNAPTAGSYAATNIAPLLVNIGLAADQANELAFQAEQAIGDQLNDPETQAAITSVINVTGLSTDASPNATNTLDSNNSYVLVRGVALQEIAFAYGIPLFGGKLRVGVAPKIIAGTTFYDLFEVSDEADGVNSGGDIIDELRDIMDGSETDTNRFSVDLGLAYAPWKWLEVGLAGKNLIPADFPFKQPASGIVTIPDFEIEPQVRAGILVQPLKPKWLRLAMDLDVTKNSTSLFPGYQERILGAGVELAPKLWIFRLGLRGGVVKNLEDSGSGLAYTFGLGLRAGVFYLAADGRLGDKKVQIESTGDDYPTSAGLSVNFGINVRF